MVLVLLQELCEHTRVIDEMRAAAAAAGLDARALIFLAGLTGNCGIFDAISIAMVVQDVFSALDWNDRRWLSF